MSRVSSTPKRYAGSSYTSHYSSYSSSLTPGISSYSERDRLSTYKSPTSISSSGYSSSYLSSSTVRGRNYSASSDPDRDRGRTIPRTDILGSSSSSRRSESLSRTPVKSYGTSGLSGGSAYSGYSSYSSSPAQSSYLSSSQAASSISLNRRKSVSQSDLSRDLSSLSLSDASSSTSALRSYRSRTKDVGESYDVGSRPGCSSLLRSSTQEALSRSSTQEAFSSSSSRAFSSSVWEPSSNGLSDSLSRNSTVSPIFLFCFYLMCALPERINK
ncbi:hypothetical protein AMECASPLE_027933 [Ameca splendens]|uniref:Uncharacterized protein n=1 Tax=Ameca splendens TaxID=208324 RepID=A0ABV0Y556_9TELE